MRLAKEDRLNLHGAHIVAMGILCCQITYIFDRTMATPIAVNASRKRNVRNIGQI